MTTSKVLTIAVSAVSDFMITAGAALSAVMVSGGEPTMPSTAAVVLAVIGGIVASARRLQAMLEEPPR